MQQYKAGWYMPPGSPLPQHAQHLPQQLPSQPGPSRMPISPRSPSPQVPGTPTQIHVVPDSEHPHALPSSHSSSTSTSFLSSRSQTPPISSHKNLPSSGSVSARLNTNASVFMPARPASRIVIKFPVRGALRGRGGGVAEAGRIIDATLPPGQGGRRSSGGQTSPREWWVHHEQ